MNVFLVLCVVVASARTSDSFAGIRNSGNTCYLNSLLQTLYHCRPFREALLRSTQATKKRKRWRRLEAAEALAKVFATLDRNATAQTRPLTRALAVDPRQQQDAQEYLRLLLDHVEDLSAYEGELEAYLRVTEEEREDIGEAVESRRVERFLDLSLEIAGRRSVEAAFDAYFAPEQLTGDLQWRTKLFGKRDAEKGVVLKKAPPFLVLHLKRFAYDFETDQVTKLHDPLTIPTALDLASKFATSDEECPDDAAAARYRLQAVVCHVGDGIAGHYYALVDPAGDGNWLRFDDERVSRVDEATVLEEGRGLRHCSAYLLQYKRVSH